MHATAPLPLRTLSVRERVATWMRRARIAFSDNAQRRFTWAGKDALVVYLAPRLKVGGRDDATIRIGMTSAAPTRVLVVAHRTAATPRLLDEVRARARRSPCTFTLLVPRPYWDPDTEAAAATLELAIPLLDEAAGAHVAGIVGDSDPFDAVQEAVKRTTFDEIIISTLPARVSQWLRRDLPHRVQGLGLPVTVVTAKQSEHAVSDAR